uniref:Transmembrane protein n=1 Tax=Heterorhabditis bacteriophora TaxID=37862 RepID=A0A1I7X0A2_HETBA
MWHPKYSYEEVSGLATIAFLIPLIMLSRIVQTIIGTIIGHSSIPTCRTSLKRSGKRYYSPFRFFLYFEVSYVLIYFRLLINRLQYLPKQKTKLSKIGTQLHVVEIKVYTRGLAMCYRIRPEAESLIFRVICAKVIKLIIEQHGNV